MSVIGKRLKEARLSAGLSQERLGILSGIDEMSASARMNQYERGVHTPGYEMVEQFAKVLGLPIEYFYSADDDIAKLLLAVNELTPEYKVRALENVRTLLKEQNKPKPDNSNS